MTRRTLVTGTGWRNDDGSSRARLIRHHIRVGTPVVLRKDEDPSPESHGIAVFLRVPRWMGMWGSRDVKIGFVEAGIAAALREKLQNSHELNARVDSLHAPPEKDHPRVGLVVEL